jgi:hypothetical protein
VTLRNIPVDLGKLSLFMVTSAPEVRVDINTGEVRTDRASGLPSFLVGLLVKVEGERRAYVLDVQVPGEPVGVVEGVFVDLDGLEAAPWERDGRSGVVYRAKSIKPAASGPRVQVTATSGAAPAEPGPGGSGRAGRGGGG